MQTVGIRDLKTHLSRYIGAVKRGETILVTDHNTVVAEIKSPAGKNRKSNANQFLEEQFRMGRITPATVKKSRIAQIVRDFSGHPPSKAYDWKKNFDESRADRI